MRGDREEMKVLVRLLLFVLWTAHLVLNIVGWSLIWSVTYVEIKSNHSSAEFLKLYTATFWDNINQFWQSGAGGMAVIIVLGGFVQPIVKCFALAAIAIHPMTPSAREKILRIQEATSKMSITPFYVEAILLEVR